MDRDSLDDISPPPYTRRRMRAAAPPSVRTTTRSIEDVAVFCETHLSTMIRGSGETYAAHGKEVSMCLREITNDESLVAVAMLHDLLVHPEGEALLEVAPLEIEERALVRSMFTLRRLHIDEKTDDLDMVMDAFTENPRLLMLRMAHRLNDVRHLSRFTRKRRKQMTRETLHMYTAIAGRLGFHRWRWQMEDLCFQELHPKTAMRVRENFEARKELDEACLKHTQDFLQENFSKRSINCSIDVRIKGDYSTYRKMILKKRPFEEIVDRLALRILVETPDDCYRALGIVHSCMHPIPGKLKDYIGTPKENGYRSIHTIVYPLPGVTEQPIEIQIRTFDMHREAEIGPASHADYKQWAYALTSRHTRANLTRNLAHLRSFARSPRQFEQALMRHFREDRLIIFDEQNNLHHLPRSSTALDFVQQSGFASPETVQGVRINGRVRPLETSLRDGDTVEIHGPSAN